MISKVAVFHRGGAVLWRSGSGSGSDVSDGSDEEDDDDMNDMSSYNAINKLIQSILLSDKSASDSMIYDSLTLKWTFANNFDLVFVAVYFSFQKLLYVDDLLQTLKNEFIKMFNQSLKGGICNLSQQNYSQFYFQFKRIQKYYKTRYKSDKRPKKWHETLQGQQHEKYKYNEKDKDKDKKNNDDDDEDEDDAPSGVSFGKKSFGKKASGPRAFDPNKRSKSGKNVKKGKENKKNKKKRKKKGKEKGKEKEHWSSFDVYSNKKKKVSQKDMDELNFANNENENNWNESNDDLEELLWSPTGSADLEESEDSDDDYSDLLLQKEEELVTSTGIWNRFSKLIGNKALESSDIESVLRDLENQLSDKNVANAIARQLCDSLRQQLIGKKIGTFNTIRSVVKRAMTDSLQRILTPQRPINILHGIKSAQSENRPYTIVFIGVNGVGKSTSLSKVIYYLKSRNLRVSVAACDTFRSGAVEQLKTHCRALNVRLFSQGYARDAGSVASRAIKEGAKQGDDVILVDTAGRMQNNAPLMKSLASLIQRNKPDLTLFVGEALVGNDGVDQLMEFNKALSIGGNTHLVDAIILTKFDTVDDKVGAAISMTYKSRKPIIFIGTGQKYPDLKRMHVGTLIDKLLQ